MEQQRYAAWFADIGEESARRNSGQESLPGERQRSLAGYDVSTGRICRGGTRLPGRVKADGSASALPSPQPSLPGLPLAKPPHQAWPPDAYAAAAKTVWLFSRQPARPGERNR